MARSLTCLALMICLGCSALAQSSSQDEKNQKMLADAARKGQPLATDITVKTNVRAQAVLIPRVDANRIFGKEIAENYAVIQLIVGNKSSDAALIIHGIFIDYTGWALSGTTSNSPPTTIEGLEREREAQFQASSNPNHIASEEYRVVRGQLLDAQMWSKRNWTMRALTFIGSLAGASVFSFTEKGPLNTINAFNSIFVPGAATLWPDGTVAQLNRVSDFGYQTNKVVPQQGSEIIVCFFPIDRFLTPGFRRLFLRSPALFFAPLQMLLDKTIEADVNAVLGKNFGLGKKITLATLKEKLPCYVRIERQRREGSTGTAASRGSVTPGDTQSPATSDGTKTLQASMDEKADDTCLGVFGLKSTTDGKIEFIDADEKTKERFQSFLLLDYISQMSLNNVKIVVDGVMTVDTTAIAAKIHEIEFDTVTNCGDDKKLCFWTDLEAGKGVRSATLQGSYLTGGKVKIAEAEALGLTDIKTITEGSSDQLLHFSFKLTNPVASGTKLHFIVTKPLPGTAADAKDPKTKDSLEWEYVVGFPYTGPTIDKVELNATQSELTITGNGFVNVKPNNALVVILDRPEGEDLEMEPKSVTPTKVVIELPKEKEFGCWSVKVKVGGLVAREFPPPPPNHKTSFIVLPSPTLGTAKVDGDTIVVTGTGFTVAKNCDKDPLVTFHLVKEGDTQRDRDALTILDSDFPTKATLHLPAKVKKQTGPWKIRVMVEGKEVSGINPVNLEGVKPVPKKPN